MIMTLSLFFTFVFGSCFSMITVFADSTDNLQCPAGAVGREFESIVNQLADNYPLLLLGGVSTLGLFWVIYRFCNQRFDVVPHQGDIVPHQGDIDVYVEILESITIEQAGFISLEEIQMVLQTFIITFRDIKGTHGHQGIVINWLRDKVNNLSLDLSVAAANQDIALVSNLLLEVEKLTDFLTYLY